MSSIIFIALFGVCLLGMVAYLPYAILSWLWLTLQVPHQIVGVDFQFNLAVVIVCGIGLIFNLGKAKIWIDGTIVALFILVIHAGITTFQAYNTEYSYPYFDRLWKTLALCIFFVLFMQNRTRIHAIVWVSVISLGAIAAKGAAFAVLTAGQFRVFGPMGSQINDNNHFAGVLCMVIPLAVYLYRTSQAPIVRRGLLVLLVMLPLSILFTYSRTGLLTLLVVSFCYWLQASARIKIITAVSAVVVALIAVPLMPDEWTNRMGTIATTLNDSSQADESIKGRFLAWEVYYKVAVNSPWTGGGFRAPELRDLWVQYIPIWPLGAGGKAAHNNILQVLGEHGFLGLGIYLLVIALAFKNACLVVLRTRHILELSWARSLAGAIGVSLIAYMIAGLTISIPYYDLFIVLVILASLLNRLVKLELVKKLKENEQGRFLHNAMPRRHTAAGILAPGRSPQLGRPQ